MAFTDLFYFLLILLILLAFFAVFWLVAGYILFRLVDRKLRRCPNCKRGGTGIIIDSELESHGIRMDRMGKEMVRTRFEKVIDHYECSRCGHTWIRSFERKERLPVQGRKAR